jgi:hypothetical protein
MPDKPIKNSTLAADGTINTRDDDTKTPRAALPRVCRNYFPNYPHRGSEREAGPVEGSKKERERESLSLEGAAKR